MISSRFRFLALPFAAALLMPDARVKVAAAAAASPTPGLIPAGLTFDKIAGTAPTIGPDQPTLDLSKASGLVMFRITYAPGATWDFNVGYPLLVAIEAGSIFLDVHKDPIIVARPTDMHGQPDPNGKGTWYAPTNFPVTLTGGDSFSSQSGRIGATSNVGDVPVQLLVAGAVIQPPLTEEVTSETSDATPSP